MEKLADISQFEALQNQADNAVWSQMGMFNSVENAPIDLTSNPDGSVSQGGVQPAASIPGMGDGTHIPDWGKLLSKRVTDLEHKVDTGFEKLWKDADTGLKKLEERIMEKMVTKDDLKQYFGER